MKNIIIIIIIIIFTIIEKEEILPEKEIDWDQKREEPEVFLVLI